MPLNFDFAQLTASPGQAMQSLATLRSQKGFALENLTQGQIDNLLAVFGNSNFFSRWAQRYPEKVLETLRSPWETRLGLKDFRRELAQRIPDAKALSREILSAKLIDFKYRHLFRITLKDLCGRKPFEEIVAELSDLARAIVQSALEWQESELVDRWGRVEDGVHPGAVPFTVLAMGKLGGNELNFSSDLDLIYFYGSDEGHVALQQRNLNLTPHEYFSKLSERLTQFLLAKTPEGFLYRIDLELRPEGKSGTLANSIDAMEDYYESFGADWEKQAMIKAGWAAGDPALVTDFLNRIHPFVYPKTTAYPILAGIRNMKEKIVQSIRQHHPETFHVKLGDGGIREIEFFVQSMQLLFGGNVLRLQTPNTLEALDRLHQAKLIEDRERSSLASAYVFLRNLEHRLQLVEEQQTHSMPATAIELNQLARRMGYTQPDPEQAREAMESDLDRHRREVMGIFNDLLSHRFGE
jgi:Glutamine synthetase adenylyltransferase